MGSIWCVARVNLSQTLQWNSPGGGGLLDCWPDKVSRKSNFLPSPLFSAFFFFLEPFEKRELENYDYYMERREKVTASIIHSSNSQCVPGLY